MNVHMKLSEILMDELPQEHPWKGNIKGLVEMLIANGVTFAKDTNVLTNADRFRAMSDEEQQKCVRRFWEIEDFADWLKQPAEVKDDDS